MWMQAFYVGMWVAQQASFYQELSHGDWMLSWFLDSSSALKQALSMFFILTIKIELNDKSTIDWLFIYLA